MPFPAEALIALLALTAVALALLCWLQPLRRVRFLLGLVRTTTYRLHVLGSEHVPAAGGVLLVCNPAHYLDCLLVLAACPRPLRLVVLGAWASRGWAGRLLRWAGALVPPP